MLLTNNTVKLLNKSYGPFFLSGQCALLPGKANAKLSSFLDVARRGQTRVVLCCLTACVCVRQSVCAWTEWLPYSQTLFMVGMLLGSLFGGAISDRYHSLGKTRGKKPPSLPLVPPPPPALFLFYFFVAAGTASAQCCWRACACRPCVAPPLPPYLIRCSSWPCAAWRASAAAASTSAPSA